MKKILLLIIITAVVSCAPKKNTSKEAKPLFEILTEQNDGGASIRFYEILTQQKEIKMLLGDEHLKNKINESDINAANFLILNAGEKPSTGYSSTIETIQELPDKIVITVKESAPKTGDINAGVMSYPYTIVKINSKKPIEIK